MTYPIDKLVMKRRAFLSLSLLGVVGTLMSCGGLFPTNQGFPRKVMFDSEGGVKVVRGSKDLYGVEIRTFGGSTIGCDRGDSERGDYAQKDWLTAKFNVRTGEMTLIVEPNSTGKSRRLVIGGMVMDSGVDIEVYQGAE